MLKRLMPNVFSLGRVLLPAQLVASGCLWNVMTAEAGPSCPQHPETVATYICERCQKAICFECCYSLPDGSICCKTCWEQPAVAEQPPGMEPSSATATPPDQFTTPPDEAEPVRIRLAPHQPAVRAVTAAASTVLPAGVRCAQHPNSP